MSSNFKSALAVCLVDQEVDALGDGVRMRVMTTSLAGKCAVVTGGAGFIGSHLVDRLLELGASKIRVLDSLSFGSHRNLPESDERVELHTTDIGAVSPDGLMPALEGVDYVFHLAAEKHNASLGNPAKMLLSNVQGTLNILTAAKRQGVRRVVFTSSLYAYGRIRGEAYREEETVAPSTVYGISKVAGEQLAAMFSKEGVETVTLRYLFVYGPRQWANAGYKSVIVKNFERIIAGEPPVIFGDGRQALDYVYVSDVVEGTIKAALAATSGGIFNIGSGNATRINDLTALMSEIAGYNKAPVFAPPDWTDGSYRVADISKVTRELNWLPAVELHDGLQRTYDWMRERR